VELRLVKDRVHWRGDPPASLVAEARKHRDAIRRYLARRCEACSRSRPVMVMMDADAPWWLCARCYRAGDTPSETGPGEAGSLP
jgi:hypothetical protein